MSIRSLFATATSTSSASYSAVTDFFGDGSGKAFYKFDGNANDESGNYNGTEVTALYGGGVYDRALICKGTAATSYVTTPFTFSTAAGTVSCWVYVDPLNSGLGELFGYVSTLQQSFCRTDYTFQLNGAWCHQLPAGEKLCTNTGEWYHIVFTTNGTSALKAYVNGVLRTNLIATACSFNGFQLNGIGWQLAGNAANLYGKIDHLRVFNRAVTAAEVTALYNEAKPTSILANNNPFSDASCVAMYKLDGDTTDALGVYNGTPTAITYAAGKFGQCAVFDGTTSQVNIADSNTFTPVTHTGISFSIWIYKSANPAALGHIISKGGTSNYEYAMVLTSNGTPAIYLYTPGGTGLAADTTTTIAIPNNTWTHLVFCIQNTEFTKMYINGVLAGGVTFATTLTNGTAPVILGTRVIGDYRFTGSMDQFRIFNKILTPMEVAALYNETTPLEFPLSYQPDPFKDGSGKALWRLEGNALDESGNYNGTATSVTYAAGISGRCGVFNGSSSKITTTINFWSLPLGRSLSFWIKSSPNVYQTPISSVASGSGYLQEFPSGSVNMNIYSTTNAVIGTAAVFDNTWHHIVVVQSASNTYMYKDGVLVSTAGADGVNATTMIIGAYNAGTQWLSGTLDQIRIFNRVLTSAEITQLFNNQA